jgi:hypothetical protein
MIRGKGIQGKLGILRFREGFGGVGFETPLLTGGVE